MGASGPDAFPPPGWLPGGVAKANSSSNRKVVAQLDIAPAEEEVTLEPEALKPSLALPPVTLSPGLHDAQSTGESV